MPEIQEKTTTKKMVNKTKVANRKDKSENVQSLRQP